MMTKILTFLLSLVISTAVFADKFTPGKLIFQDGNVLAGRIKPPDNTDSKIVFQLNENGNIEKYNSDLIKTLIFYFEDDTVEYDRIKTYGLMGKKIYNANWIMVVERGYVTLYFANLSPQGTVSLGAASQTDKFFYCLRPNEEAAKIVSWYIGKVNANETFKRNGYKYFIDYPVLAEKIKNKTYKYDNIIEVVREYNNWKKS